jgi:hypothetical protein
MQISIVISTKYFYIAELVQMPVLTAHSGESLYKTGVYGNFLNLYSGGRTNSIFCCTEPMLRFDMDPNVPERLLRP